MFRTIKDYMIDDKFKITITDDMVNIDNYDEIITLEKDLIIIKNKQKEIVFKGDNITLGKLLDMELLIKGNIKHIELECSDVSKYI